MLFDSEFFVDLYESIRDHFKRSKTSTPPPPPPPPPPVYTSEEIHNDLIKMYSAWYAEISALAAKPLEADLEAYQKLRELGFDKFEGMKEASNKKGEFDNAVKCKATIDRYTPAYPTYPLIPKSLLEVLCEKYNLIIGKTEEYVKDIPERAIADILNFKFKDEDRKLYYESVGYYAYQNEWVVAKMPKEITDSQKEELNAGKKVYVISKNNSTTAYQYRTRFVIVAPKAYFSKDSGNIYAGCNDPIVLVELGDQMYMIITMW